MFLSDPDDFRKNLEPTPARPGAIALAKAFSTFLTAQTDLAREKRAVPSYTGQYDSKDYYGQEQEDYNRAADALADAIITLTRE